MSKYLPEDWVLWRIDRAIDQVRAEVYKSRDDYDFMENHRAFQVLSRLEDDIKDGPVRTERQIFEDYRGPEDEPTPKEETRPVVHARWLTPEGAAGDAVCSHCNVHFPAYYTGHKFCPYCGAQMDGEEGADK